MTRQPGYVLDLDPDSVDAWRFERLVKEGTRLLEDGDQDAGRSKIREALGLWSGPPLSDFPYEEFAQPVARRLTEERLTAVEAYAAASLEAGRITEALDLLTAAVQDDPLRERARELMMLALYRSGRHADALRSFHALRTQLTDEFGVDPSPSIRALYDRILAHDPSLAKGSLAGPNVRVTLAARARGSAGTASGWSGASTGRSATSRWCPEGERVRAGAYRDWSRIRELSRAGAGAHRLHQLPQHRRHAHEHPGTHYLVFDYVGAEPNVSYVHFQECEASFLAGVAAALTSQTGIVGFIGGWDAIPIWGFLAGYQAGVRATIVAFACITAYAGEWPDPQGFVDLDRNEELARQMFADGADVILAAAGPAGMGVVSAAAALSGSMGRHLWAIGVDTDWYEDLSHNLGTISPGAWRSHVLTSVRKRYDLAVYEALQTVASGDRLPPVKAYDLRSGFVDISYEGGVPRRRSAAHRGPTAADRQRAAASPVPSFRSRRGRPCPPRTDRGNVGRLARPGMPALADLARCSPSSRPDSAWTRVGASVMSRAGTPRSAAPGLSPRRPRSSKRKSLPSTRPRVTDDTMISMPAPRPAIREAAWTATPPMSFGSTSTSPV